MGFVKGNTINKGRVANEKTRKKMSEVRKGYKHLDSSKEKMRIAQRKTRNPHIEKECLICKNIFIVNYARKYTSKFCSYKCQGEYKKGKGNISRQGKHKTKTYGGLHYKVRSLRGTPSLCEVCGTIKAKRFERANLTGKYEDINDYKRMCTSCHSKFDKKICNIKHMNK